MFLLAAAIFFSLFRKILFLNGLRVDGEHDSSQNLEPFGLTRKILSNNDLRSCREIPASPFGW
jgi:hypothetical protein